MTVISFYFQVILCILLHLHLNAYCTYSRMVYGLSDETLGSHILKHLEC
jgi:hypothetical protein